MITFVILLVTILNAIVSIAPLFVSEDMHGVVACSRDVTLLPPSASPL